MRLICLQLDAILAPPVLGPRGAADESTWSSLRRQQSSSVIVLELMSFQRRLTQQRSEYLSAFPFPFAYPHLTTSHFFLFFFFFSCTRRRHTWTCLNGGGERAELTQLSVEAPLFHLLIFQEVSLILWGGSCASAAVGLTP